jgi:hypothetical protein
VSEISWNFFTAFQSHYIAHWNSKKFFAFGCRFHDFFLLLCCFLCMRLAKNHFIYICCMLHYLSAIYENNDVLLMLAIISSVCFCFSLQKILKLPIEQPQQSNGWARNFCMKKYFVNWMKFFSLPKLCNIHVPSFFALTLLLYVAEDSLLLSDKITVLLEIINLCFKTKSSSIA